MTLLQETESLKKTPLYDRHLSLQGKIVNFGGWALPVYYTGIIAEHEWTRKSCGIFDVSHLGEIRVQGPGAYDFLQFRLTNDLAKMEDGSMLYALLCDEKGCTLDDLVIYRSKPDDYYLVVNAAGIQGDEETLLNYASGDVTITNHSDQMACIAVQGPQSERILETLFQFNVQNLAYYHFKEEKFRGQAVWVSRSGYTGEDGFEIFSPNELAPLIWDRLVKDGKSEGTAPVGLGARNTLRLEAGNVLYGNDLNETTTPLEAGLQWAVALGKGRFVGRDRLMQQKEKGLERRLVGFRVLERSVAREGYPIFKNGEKTGFVTSGSFGPSIGCNIGLGYVRKGLDIPGTVVEVEVRGKVVKVGIAKLPFVPLRHKGRERAK